MPTRSSGCLTCRKRKIRCDERRPGCLRCETHGVSCPGYRIDKAGGIEFKDQSAIVANKAEGQYRAKALRALKSKSPEDADSLNGSMRLMDDEDDDDHQRYGSSLSTGSSTANTTTPISSRHDDDSDDQALTLYRTTPPTRILSPDAERAKLYGDFISTYLPITQAGAQNGHFSFFQTVALKRSTNPTLQSGFDALSLVQLGSLKQDKALLKQSVHEYSKALNSLGSSLRNGEFMYDDDVLAAVGVLATCELFQEVAEVGNQGWAKHVQGSNELVALRGPQSLQSELALLLYANMRHASLIHALIFRKAPFMATPEWREVAYRVPSAMQDSSTTFYDAAIQVPGLLEKRDKLDLEASNAVQDIDALLVESAELESTLRTWFTKWQATYTQTSFNNQPVYTLLPITSFPTFCSLCSDRTLEHAYMFPDFLIGYEHSLYWVVMHYLRTNTQSLQKQRRSLHVWYTVPEDMVYEDELLGYVLDICRCIPYFTEPVSSSTGSIGIFLPLRCAAIYCTEHEHWEWLKWLGSVKNSVFVKGLMPPSVKNDWALPSGEE